MANEIRTILNSIPKLKNDFKQDWKEDLKVAGAGGIPKNDYGADTASVPANTVAPVIAGYTTNPAVGNTLTCPTGTWTGTGITYTYAWKLVGNTAVVSTVNSYVVPAGAAGRAWTCTVTATNTAGKISVTSAATPVSV